MFVFLVLKGCKTKPAGVHSRLASHTGLFPSKFVEFRFGESKAITDLLEGHCDYPSSTGEWVELGIVSDDFGGSVDGVYDSADAVGPWEVHCESLADYHVCLLC